MPYSSSAWIEADIPVRGALENGARYFKHGRGCRVLFDAGEVDFDFGEEGEIDGFDLWRLVQFAGDRLVDYGFQSGAMVEEQLAIAVAAGDVVFSGSCLYYVADSKRVLATEFDSRLPGDLLPSRNQDLILSLYTHYFLAADLMLTNYQKLDRKLETSGKLSRKNEVDMRVYFFSWLGFLAVTCEGFKNMNVRELLTNDRPDSFKEMLAMSDALGKMIKIHWDPLREFRNNVFHLRKSSEKVRQFFSQGADRLTWSRELHQALHEFFSVYRISCEVHYMVNKRRGEMDF
jgi:hypothetical protein